MNEKDVEKILKKYSEIQNYPNLEGDTDGIFAYFGSLEGAMNGTEKEVESEIILKINAEI